MAWENPRQNAEKLTRMKISRARESKESKARPSACQSAAEKTRGLRAFELFRNIEIWKANVWKRERGNEKMKETWCIWKDLYYVDAWLAGMEARTLPKGERVLEGNRTFQDSKGLPSQLTRKPLILEQKSKTPKSVLVELRSERVNVSTVIKRAVRKWASLGNELKNFIDIWPLGNSPGIKVRSKCG